MEMEKVPALGYRIVGLPIAGMQRRLEPRNLARCPFKAVLSVLRAAGSSAISGPTWWSVSEAMPRGPCCGRHSGWGAHHHSGAELLRRGDQQDSGPRRPPHLRRL